MNNQISLRIHSVKCIDETGLGPAERVGNDEIMLSGFGIDANATTVQVRPFEIHPHFDDGETKRFSPPRNFVTLNLANTNSFPKSCSASLILAERDNGDLGTKLAEIFDKLTQEMGKIKKEEEEKKKKRLAASATAGSASLSGVEMKVIWELVKPIIFNFIREKILLSANDDIFPPQDVSVTVSSDDFTFEGSKVSTQFPVEFHGHDGIYRATCDWELS
jgi:hypothetical protein